MANLFIKGFRHPLVQKFHKTDQMPERSPQVMGHGIGKHLQFPVGRFKLSSALDNAPLQLIIQFLNFIFRLFARHYFLFQVIDRGMGGFQPAGHLITGPGQVRKLIIALYCNPVIQVACADDSNPMGERRNAPGHHSVDGRGIDDDRKHAADDK